MPKKSKKSKSNRQTLKHKYKVLKKVKEHHRKKRKEAKKNGTLHKEPKDPGIPNAWPFKQELVQQLRAQKERAANREKALRDAQRTAAVEARGGDEMLALQEGAAQRGNAYERASTRSGGAVGAAPGGSYVDYSLKAFYRDFARVVEASDVIIEVVDARDPAGTRCLEVEKFVRRLGPNKKIILLLNKIDLVPREVVEQWLKYFREELPAVAFKCSTQKQATNLGRKALSASTDAATRGSECLGADTLLQLLKNYARGIGGLKTAITVGVVGLPNVGKSSVINSLKRTRVAAVGNAPGITKSVQEIHLDKQVTLLDSPGVVFADAGADGAAAAALRNCVKVEQLEDPALPVAEIVKRCPVKQLMTLYKVPTFTNVDEFLVHVATSRGKLRKGGTVDSAAAARIVLQDWNDGRIPYYTLPSKRDTEVAGSSAVVTDWGADFNANEVFAAEQTAVIEGLPSLTSAGGDAFFQTKSTGAVHVSLEEAAMAADAGGDSGEEEEEDGMSGSDMEDQEGSESEGDEMDEEDAPPAVGRGVTGKSAQNKQLYSERGQFNPHAARAERKKKRKSGGDAATEEAAAAAGGNSDSDFDFNDGDWQGATHDNAFAGLADGSESDME